MAVMAWYSEINYDFSKGKPKSSGQGTGHFTAEIQDTVSKVGIGIAGGYSNEEDPDDGVNLIVVANFSPTPNIMLSMFEGQFDLEIDLFESYNSKLLVNYTNVLQFFDKIKREEMCIVCFENNLCQFQFL